VDFIVIISKFEPIRYNFTHGLYGFCLGWLLHT